MKRDVSSVLRVPMPASLSLPSMPSAPSHSLTCLPLPPPPFHAFHCLHHIDCFLSLAHSRASSSLATLALLPSVSYSLLGWSGPEWVHSRRVG